MLDVEMWICLLNNFKEIKNAIGSIFLIGGETRSLGCPG